MEKIFSLFLFFIMFSVLNSFGQSKVIPGIVLDKNKEPIPGVTVVVKGTNRGTATDINGKYSISVAPNAKLLVFSFMGLETKEVVIGGQSKIDVVLLESAVQLDEVVAIGYGVSRKIDLTGSVSSLNGAEIMKVPVSSAAEALTGKIAGVQVKTTSGEPGADILIRVRGGGSITQDNSPLYIIDGFVSEEGLKAINVNDIESIDVLKDASSTAIYGARGANGVILITTKKGKEGKTIITYDGYYGYKHLSKKIGVLDPYDFVVLTYENNMEGAIPVYGQFSEYESLYKGKPGINWQEKVMGEPVPTQSHTLAMTGGTNITKYKVSYTNNNENGLMLNTGFKRNSIRFSLDQKASDKLSLSFNGSFSNTKTIGGGLFGGSTRLRNLVQFRPIGGKDVPDDNLAEILNDPMAMEFGLYDLINPVIMQEIEQVSNISKSTNLNGNADFSITKNLVLKVTGGYYYNLSKNSQYVDGRSRAAILKNGPYGSITYNESSRWQNANTLTYTKRTKSGHNLNLMLGNEQVFNKSNYLIASAEQFPESNLGLAKMDMAVYPLVPSTSESSSGMISFFGRSFYGYKDKYLFTATFRADGSSKFAKKNRYGYFPSVSTAWRINQENFMKNLTVISNLKLRLSYGQSGNNRISDYSYATKFAINSYAIGTSEQPALTADGLANPDLKWETTISRNIGLDFGIFKNRITGSVDVYKNTTRDLLIAAKIRVESGYSTQYQNIGSTENRGLEFVLNTLNISSKNFRWNTDFNISFNKSKVLELFGGEVDNLLFASGAFVGTSDFLVRVGEPLGQMYGFKYDGFYNVDDFNYDAATSKYTLKDNVPYYGSRTSPQPGTIKFKDLDGRLDANGYPIIEGAYGFDKTVIGNANPKHFGGINNTFSYKNIDLSIFMNWVYGNNILNANKVRFTSQQTNLNLLDIAKDRWMTINAQGVKVTDPVELTELNKNATLHKLTYGYTECYDWAVEDGSFLRINNVTLGYSLPEKLIGKAHITKCRFYVTAYNPFIFTKYSGYDPEVDSRGPLSPGVDLSSYPKSRSFIFGLNLAF